MTLHHGMHSIPAALAAAIAGSLGASEASEGLSEVSKGIAVGHLQSHATFPRSAAAIDPLWRLLAPPSTGGDPECATKEVSKGESKGVGTVTVDVVTEARVRALVPSTDPSGPVSVVIAAAGAGGAAGAQSSSNDSGSNSSSNSSSSSSSGDGGVVWSADYVYSTLPAATLAPLLTASASATTTAATPTSAVTATSAAGPVSTAPSHAAPLTTTTSSSSSSSSNSSLIAAAAGVASQVRSTNVWVVTVGFSAHQTTTAANDVAVINAAADRDRFAEDIFAGRPKGFGFLVPSSAVPTVTQPALTQPTVTSASAQFDEEGRDRSHPLYGLLGVVFDSDTFPTVTSTNAPSASDEEPPVLMTMMVGGDRFPDALTWTKEEVLKHAQCYLWTVLRLRVKLPSSPTASGEGDASDPSNWIVPAVFTAELCKQCIPQPAPGQTRAVQAARAAVAGGYGVCDLRNAPAVPAARSGGLNGEGAERTNGDGGVRWVGGGAGAGWDLLLPTAGLAPTVPLSLDTLLISSDPDSSKKRATSEPAAAAAAAEAGAESLGSIPGARAPIMASTLLQSAGLVHPRVVLGGTMVTGPAVKDLIREARFAALRMARHIRAREAVEAAQQTT